VRGSHIPTALRNAADGVDRDDLHGQARLKGLSEEPVPDAFVPAAVNDAQDLARRPTAPPGSPTRWSVTRPLMTLPAGSKVRSPLRDSCRPCHGVGRVNVERPQHSEDERR
jgi:hypothetical protein